MPDMLVRLYALPDSSPYYRRAAEAGLKLRRADPWDRPRLKTFIREHFSENWALEADRAFGSTPISAYVAVKDGELAGFAAYDVSCRNFFGPTGVREDCRGNGLGAALLFRCLESMREAGYGYAIIGWVGPAAFYERICGAIPIPGSDVSVFGSLQEQIARQQ